MPLLILEGPDGSGKSTLAARLLKGTGHSTLLIKRSGPPNDVETLQFQSRWIANQAKQGLNVIADRHPLISEAIYAPTVRRVAPPPWSLADVGVILKKTDVRVIYCRPSLEALKRGSRIETQIAGVHDWFMDLVGEYDRWMITLNEYGVMVGRYDWEGDVDAYAVTQAVREYWGMPR